MNKKNCVHNQAGITLLELLVVLAISTFIIAMLTTALITTFKNREIIDNQIGLRQEAAIIIAKLRQAHKSDSYTLCKQGGKLYFDYNGQNEFLSSERITFKAMEEDGDLVKNGSSFLKEDYRKQCIPVNSTWPLLVNFSIVDENGNQFHVETAIEKLSAYEPPLYDDPVEEEIEFGDDREEEKDIPGEEPGLPSFAFEKREDFQTRLPLNRNEVEVLDWYSLLLGKDSTNRSAYFPSGLNMIIPLNREFIVGENLFVDNNASIIGNNRVTVNGSALFENNLSLTNANIFREGAKLRIEENLFVKKKIGLQGPNIDLRVKGSARADEGVEITSGNSVGIGHHFFGGGAIQLEGGSDLIVNGNAYLDRGTYFVLKGNSSFIVNGAVYIGDKKYEKDFYYNGYLIEVNNQ